MRSINWLGTGILILVVVLVSLFFFSQRTPGGAPVGAENGDIVIDAEAVASGFVDITDEAATGFARMFGDFIDQIYNVPRSEIVRVLMVIGGVVLLLAGWRIYNWIIIVAGIIIGASTAVALVGDVNTVMMVAALLMGALIGGFIAAFAYYVAVFFIGAYVGLILTGAVATSLNMTPVSIWILLVAALLGGLVLIGLSFELLVLLSSIVGAQLIVIALGLQPQGLWLIGLTLLGVILQAYATRRFGYAIRRAPSRNPLRRAA